MMGYWILKSVVMGFGVMNLYFGGPKIQKKEGTLVERVPSIH
jgi:hypothetical protein